MLDKKRLLEIKEIAESLLGMSLNNIAEEKLIDIKTVDFKDFPSKQNKNVSGIIFKIDNPQEKYKYAILINKADSINRRRFTLAHELGHYFLHKNDYLDKKKGFFIDHDSAYLYRTPGEEYEALSSEYKKLEEEANEFAGCLLMPEDVISDYKDKMSAKDLAELFQVSELAVTVRLYNLTLRNNAVK